MLVWVNILLLVYIMMVVINNLAVVMVSTNNLSLIMLHLKAVILAFLNILNLINVLDTSLKKEEKLKKSQEVRQATVARYDWDDCAKVWMDYIDNYKPSKLESKWNSPPKIHNIPESAPENVSNDVLVEFLYNNVLAQPQDAFGYEATKLLRDLNIGAVVDHGVVEPIDKQKIFNKYKEQARNQVVVEQVRSGFAHLNPEPFIEVANQNDRS